MPKICTQCDNVFPIWWKDDTGKAHNFRNRTKCLICSPFRSKTTAQHDVHNKRQRDLEYQRNKQKRHYKRFKETHKIDPTVARRRHRKRLIVWICGGCCQLCHYDKTDTNLVFHHLRDKKFELSRLYKPLNETFDEIKKCIMVCHNCHGEVHQELIPQHEIEKANLKLVELVDNTSVTTWTHQVP